MDGYLQCAPKQFDYARIFCYLFIYTIHKMYIAIVYEVIAFKGDTFVLRFLTCWTERVLTKSFRWLNDPGMAVLSVGWQTNVFFLISVFFFFYWYWKMREWDSETILSPGPGLCNQVRRRRERTFNVNINSFGSSRHVRVPSVYR